MARPEAVVFDIGNVLLEWNPERFYDARIGPERRARFFADADPHGMNAAVDAGADLAVAVAAHQALHPDWAEEIGWWRSHWLDMASPRIDGSVALLRALRARGVPVFALTNFGAGLFDFARGHYDFLDEFDRAWVSGRLGVIKPDPAIYRCLETDSGLSGGALLFTDDRPENIVAAEARGWATHLFTGWQPWAARLVLEGLLTPKEAGL